MANLRKTIGFLLDNSTRVSNIFHHKKSCFYPMAQERLISILKLLDSSDNLVVYLSHEDDRDVNTLEGFRRVSPHNFSIIEIVNSKNEISQNNLFSRKNLGRDLGSIRDLMKILVEEKVRINSITFINSSVSWNPIAFYDLVEKLISQETIFYPIISFQPKRHLQSYFFIFPKKYFANINQVFGTLIRNWKWKRAIVFLGEKKLLEKFENLGLASSPVVTMSQVIEITDSKDLRSYNPSLLYGLEIYNRKLFPGVKRVLLENKPYLI